MAQLENQPLASDRMKHRRGLPHWSDKAEILQAAFFRMVNNYHTCGLMATMSRYEHKLLAYNRNIFTQLC